MAELSAQEMLDSVASESSTTGGVGENSTQAPAAAQTQTTPGNWWDNHLKNEIEYQIEGGKRVKEPLEMVLKRANLGYNYAQRAHILNSKEEHYKGLEEKIKSLSRWQEYDDYAAQNKEWADHVDHSWKNRDTLLQSNQGQLPFNNELNSLREQVKTLLPFKDEWEKYSQERAQLKINEENKQFASEIGSVAKNFGEKFGIDMSQADEQGRTLEWRTLEYMDKMKLDASVPGQFEMAFKAMNFDNLLAKHEEKVKEEHAKRQLELKQAGIRGISRTPKQDDDFNGYRPGMSRSELREAALNYYMKNAKGN